MILLRLLLERGELGVSEGAAHLGVAPSTAHRLLATMADHGFVAQTRSRRYRAGELLTGGGEPRNRNAAIAATLRPVVQSLFEAVGETVHLMVLVGSDIQFIDGVEGGQALRIGLRLGGRLPAYCTSGGKAILAELDDRLVAAMHVAGVPSWPGQRIHTLDELRRELAEVRGSQIAVNRGESELGVRALGAAVGPAGGRPVAALTISLPAERFGSAHRKELAVELLKAKAQATALL